MLRILLETTFSLLKGSILDTQLQRCQFVKENVHRNKVITTVMFEILSYLFIISIGGLTWGTRITRVGNFKLHLQSYNDDGNKKCKLEGVIDFYYIWSHDLPMHNTIILMVIWYLIILNYTISC